MLKNTEKHVTFLCYISIYNINPELLFQHLHYLPHPTIILCYSNKIFLTSECLLSQQDNWFYCPSWSNRWIVKSVTFKFQISKKIVTASNGTISCGKNKDGEIVENKIDDVLSNNYLKMIPESVFKSYVIAINWHFLQRFYKNTSFLI